MQEFKDSEGRRWQIRLTLGGVKRILDELGVDLLNLSQYADSSENSITMRLVNDDLFVGRVVAVLLAEQAKNYAVENTLDIFDGATTNAAQEAFFSEFAFFFKDRKNKAAEKFANEIRQARATIAAGEKSSESQDAAV